uniref:Uncharacterized protein n=1 Tax=Physcomitrium patens TaxID=3218 RepID=A0A2K1K2T0_PHYPA|nr:hypothetical protein PHYPA_012555 [Physcomitrium patens]
MPQSRRIIHKGHRYLLRMTDFLKIKDFFGYCFYFLKWLVLGADISCAACAEVASGFFGFWNILKYQRGIGGTVFLKRNWAT